MCTNQADVYTCTMYADPHYIAHIFVAALDNVQNTVHSIMAKGKTPYTHVCNVTLDDQRCSAIPYYCNICGYF